MEDGWGALPWREGFVLVSFRLSAVGRRKGAQFIMSLSGNVGLAGDGEVQRQMAALVGGIHLPRDIGPG
ncbi:unnamed protein product [Boreogadus saida]